MAYDTWNNVQAEQEARETGRAPHGRTALVDLVKGDVEAGQCTAEAILAHLLWHLADAEAETHDADIPMLVADACELADAAGIKWTSGR